VPQKTIFWKASTIRNFREAQEEERAELRSQNKDKAVSFAFILTPEF
jgi:hypothetical protein